MDFQGKAKRLFSLLKAPILMFLFYISLVAMWKLFSLPTTEQLISMTTSILKTYGLWFVFLGALIEATLLIGNYFPGGLLIFLSVISAGGDLLRALWVVITVALAWLTAQVLNFVLGKYGWYTIFSKLGFQESLEKYKTRLEKYEHKAILFGYWNPSLSALTSTAAGILQMEFQEFLMYAAVAVTFWNAFWGTVVFYWGEDSLKLMTSPKYALIVLGLWVIGILFVHWMEQRTILHI